MPVSYQVRITSCTNPASRKATDTLADTLHRLLLAHLHTYNTYMKYVCMYVAPRTTSSPNIHIHTCMHVVPHRLPPTTPFAPPSHPMRNIGTPPPAPPSRATARLDHGVGFWTRLLHRVASTRVPPWPGAKERSGGGGLGDFLPAHAAWHGRAGQGKEIMYVDSQVGR